MKIQWASTSNTYLYHICKGIVVVSKSPFFLDSTRAIFSCLGTGDPIARRKGRVLSMASPREALSRLSTDHVRHLFDQVTKMVRDTTPERFVAMSDQDKLRLYGLYKHVQEGPCPDVAAPSLFHVAARSKFHSWERCKALTRTEAMIEYVEVVSERDNIAWNRCRELIDELSAEIVVNVHQDEGNTVKKAQKELSAVSRLTHAQSSEVPKQASPKVKAACGVNRDFSSASLFHYFYGLISLFGVSLCHFLGIRPLIPRGRLDISYSDLFFAIYQSCLWWKETPYHCQELSHRIRDTWADEGVAVGLSVRSLLDLYLSVKNFNDGSEVVVVPPISVAGMMRVLGFHNLQIVPIDLPEDDCQWIDVSRIKNAITSKTVAIMIVHPFGMIAASLEQLEDLRKITNDANIELWEDCAECFVGLSGNDCFLGYAKADVRFFSFGLIKTATALGGGVAIFRNLEVRQDVERLQRSMPQIQPLRTFICRAVLGLALNFVADSPWRVGTLATLCQWIGVEFDNVITKSLRGFQIRHHADQRLVEVDLIRQIRKRPSRGLLSLLLRRLIQSKTQMPPSVHARIQQCAEMERILSRTKISGLLRYGSGLRNTFWAFPIRCDERDVTSAKLVSRGFDVVSGASQLCCVSSFSGSSCPKAQRLMDSILYVPITSQVLHPDDLQRLGSALSCEVGSAIDNESSFQVECLKSTPSKLPVAITISVASYLMFHLSGPSPFNWLLLLIVSGRTLFFAICSATTLAALYSYILQCTVSNLYLNGSMAFAANCDMIDAANSERPNPDIYVASGNPIISKMETLCIPESLRQEIKKSIVLTGATGFIGSMLLRDLFVERQKLGIDQFILISRGKKGEPAESRIRHLLCRPMFSFLTNADKRAVVVLEGDVSLPSAGLSQEDLELITQDPNVSHVFHCAAAVGFTQELPSAAKANISSALVMQNIASRCTRRDVRFVHISTAFVHGGCCGSADSPLSEDLFPLGRFDAVEIYRSMLGTQFYASMAMSELGFTNSYTLSKCVCEHLLVQQRFIDTLIIRPSIVGPSVEFPFEGWAGDAPSTIVGGACLHLLNQWNLWYITSNSVSHIPVDVLSRFVIARAMEERNDYFPKSEGSSTSDESFDKVSRTSPETCSESEESSATLDKGSVSSICYGIFNATWDASSQSDTFTWTDFCISYLQLGCVLGYFGRALALLTLAVSVKIVPLLCSRDGVYEWAHNTFVRAPVLVLLYVYEKFSFETKPIEKLLSFIDLPLLFFPFVRRTYHFHSILVPPCSFDAKRYCFSVAVAAHRFLSHRGSKDGKELSEYQTTEAYLIGGKKCFQSISDCWVSFSLPRGSIFTRLSALVVNKILRSVCSAVTVDLASFRATLASISGAEGEGKILVLAPTHRSIFDFILLSYLMFVVPELHLDIPYIIAADDFKRLPFFGWFLERLRAVYIQRCFRQNDSQLLQQILNLKRDGLCVPGSSLEVFLEGKRSRDRRFVMPKTGVLKCLRESGGKHVVVPVVINYERLPEQQSLCREACDEKKRLGMNIYDLISWLRDASLGKIALGRIHIVASPPLAMDCETRDDFAAFALEIQRHQKERTMLSEFHVKAAAKLLDLPNEVFARGMTKLGSPWWPCHDDEIPPLPTDRSELMSVLLQAGHLLAPMFAIDRPHWATWLDPSFSSSTHDTDCRLDPSVARIYDALVHVFDRAESVVVESRRALQSNGFEWAEPWHLLQIAKSLNTDNVPVILICAASQFQRRGKPVDVIDPMDGEDCVPRHSVEVTNGQERLGFWGFSDSGFVVKSIRERRSVTMTGKRYRLCGQSMAKILPFIESQLGIQIHPMREFSTTSRRWTTTIEPELTVSDRVFLLENFPTSFATTERVRHGTGHSLEDVYDVRNGNVIRIPDAVVWLTSEDHALKLVEAAQERQWCLIPFGGGTNVSNATRCPDRTVEPRPIISVDMKKMNRVLFLNEEDGLAHIEAGITGRDLIEELGRRGYTMGHEPDSIEFSTLGGWIATKASGMKRSRYGNIEDIVVSTRVITSRGVLWKGSEDTEVIAGRVAEAMDVGSFVIGSEGSLGIIASAVIRIWPFPDVRKFDSIVFPCFDDGLSFVRALSKKGMVNIPASVRLLDNAHFRLGQALSPDDSSFAGKVKEVVTKLTSLVMLGSLKHHTVVCATIGYEGSRDEVIAQEATVKLLREAHGGIRLGSRVGKAGYDLTFMIAYLRDFAMTYHVMGESFETFVPWSKIDRLIPATKERIREEHRKRCLPGVPFVGCRVTQLYHEGVCLYFYLCISFDGVQNPSRVYSDLEAAARDEILKYGGSLSHHHGIGKKRAIPLRKRMSKAFGETLWGIKAAIDEDNIFGARNGPFCSE
jgi:alkyldihydroxyacetonephosphate synthase